MRLPRSRLADLCDRRTFGTSEHRDHLRLLAVVSGARGLDRGFRCSGCGADYSVQCFDGHRCPARDAKRFVTLSADEPVIAHARDQSAIGKTDDDLLTGTALDRLWKPSDLGYRADESLAGISVNQLQPVHTNESPTVCVAEGTRNRGFSSEGTYDRKDGSNFTALRSISALSYEAGQVTNYLETLVDISDLKEAQDKLRHLANFDSLTNLPNRSLFFELVDRALALARRDNCRLAIVFLDLDKFKPINDTWGHGVGDLVLQAVAQRIKACLRESDTVGRVGGDEFVALLANVRSVDDAIRVGEKIRESLNRPFEFEGKALCISSCLGIAIYPEHGLTSVSLTEHADMAMYHAKESGRNRVVVFNQDIQRRPQ